jgi:hypothetical protein
MQPRGLGDVDVGCIAIPIMDIYGPWRRNEADMPQSAAGRRVTVFAAQWVVVVVAVGGAKTSSLTCSNVADVMHVKASVWSVQSPRR